MKHNNLLLLICAILTLFTLQASAQWSHQFADVLSTSFIDLPVTNHRELNIPLIDSFETKQYFNQFLSGDVDGDGINELVALSESKDSLIVVDYIDRKVHSVPIPGTIGSFELSFLTDFDGDGIEDIVIHSETNPLKQLSVFSFLQNAVIYEYNCVNEGEVVDQSRLQQIHSFFHSFLDINHNNSKELICVTQSAGSSVVMAISDQNSSASALIEHDGAIINDTFVLFQDSVFQETYVSFASMKQDICSISTYVLGKDDNEATLLWSNSLPQHLHVSRMAMSQNEFEEAALIVGAQSNDPEQERFLSEINIFTGEEITTIRLGKADCIDLSVGDFDENGVNDVVIFTSDFNIRRVDFRKQTSRLFTIQNADHYIGGINLLSDNFGVENCTVRKRTGGIDLLLLNFSFDPIFPTSRVAINAETFSRGILGDFDGNGNGEVVIATKNQDRFKINRIFFIDPDLPSPASHPITSVFDWNLY